jgi:hypothetical protein
VTFDRVEVNAIAIALYHSILEDKLHICLSHTYGQVSLSCTAYKHHFVQNYENRSWGSSNRRLEKSGLSWQAAIAPRLPPPPFLAVERPIVVHHFVSARFSVYHLAYLFVYFLPSYNPYRPIYLSVDHHAYHDFGFGRDFRNNHRAPDDYKQDAPRPDFDSNRACCDGFPDDLDDYLDGRNYLDGHHDAYHRPDNPLYYLENQLFVRSHASDCCYYYFRNRGFSNAHLAARRDPQRRQNLGFDILLPPYSDNV